MASAGRICPPKSRAPSVALFLHVGGGSQACGPPQLLLQQQHQLMLSSDYCWGTAVSAGAAALDLREEVPRRPETWC